MTTEDLKVVQETLWDVRSKWRNLGIQLDIKVEDLETIAANNSLKVDDCFTDCITQWLRQSSPPPTWVSLIRALNSPTIRFQDLAKELKAKYMRSTSVTDHNEVVELRFPHIDEVAMNEQQRKELEQRLKLETKEIMTEFHILINRFFDTLEDENCRIDRLTRYLEKELCKEIVPQPTSVKEVQRVIDENSTFYDYKFLKYMITLAGTDKDKKGVVEYEKRFKVYAQRRVFECPCEFGAKRTPTDTELHVKLDSNYECQLGELKEFQIRLCHILSMHVFVTRLFSVEKGCFKLLILLPQHIQTSMFPLSIEQKEELISLGVLQLSCGDYIFTKDSFQVCNTSHRPYYRKAVSNCSMTVQLSLRLTYSHGSRCSLAIPRL